VRARQALGLPANQAADLVRLKSYWRQHPQDTLGTALAVYVQELKKTQVS